MKEEFISHLEPQNYPPFSNRFETILFCTRMSCYFAAKVSVINKATICCYFEYAFLHLNMVRKYHFRQKNTNA
jgi:hypothetical protein